MGHCNYNFYILEEYLLIWKHIHSILFDEKKQNFDWNDIKSVDHFWGKCHLSYVGSSKR